MIDTSFVVVFKFLYRLLTSNLIDSSSIIMKFGKIINVLLPSFPCVYGLFDTNLVLHCAQIFSFIINPLSNDLGDELTHQQTVLRAVHLEVPVSLFVDRDLRLLHDDT